MASSFIQQAKARADKAKAASEAMASQRSAPIASQVTQKPGATRTLEPASQTKRPPAAAKSPHPIPKSPQSAGNRRTQAQKSPQPNAATRLTPQKGAVRVGKGRTALSDAGSSLAATPDEVVEMFRRYSSRPDVLDQVPAEQVAAAFSAVVEGSARVGKEGAGDRQMLFRMLGLPWSQGVFGPASREAAREMGAALGDRLVRAVNRHELHLSGRAPVTVDIDADGNPASDRPSNRVGNRLLDHVPYEAPPDRAGAELRLDVPSQANHASTVQHPAAGRWQEPEAEVWGEEDEAAAR